MTIREMHILFRQLAQQMGMQTVRNITSEQVDVLLNSSIKDVLSEVVKNNVTKSADGVTQDNYKMGPINSLSSLYRRQRIDMIPDTPTSSIDNRIFMYINDQGYDHKMTTNFYRYVPSSSTQIATINDYFYIVGFNLSYTKNSHGFDGRQDSISAVNYVKPSGASQEVRYANVDIIDEHKIYDVLNDNLLKPTIKHPCIVMYSNENGKQFDLYMGNFVRNNNLYRLQFEYLPYILTMSYIAIPSTVHRALNAQDTDVDSDMPIHLHEIIVKHAVDLFIKTLSKVPFASQSNQTEQ